MRRTFWRANLGHQRPHVPDRQPVHEALPPHQRVLVDDAVHLHHVTTRVRSAMTVSGQHPDERSAANAVQHR